MRNTKNFSYAKDDYKRYMYIINKKNYVFRATLVNPKSLALELQKSAIKELILEDNVYSPFFQGSITIDNRDDALERFKSDPTLTEFDNKLQIQGYRTRGDARDVLILSIIPVENGTEPYSQQAEQFNKYYGLQIIFALTDEEDILDGKSKVKKFKIRDFDHQILSEKKLFFSSVSLLEDYDKNKQVPFLTDRQKSVETGKILKALFTNGLSDETVIYTETVNGKKTTPYFEDGSSTLFYSSPNNNTAIDDIAFIYDLHVSSSNSKDFSFLNKDQYTGEYTLESAADIFSKAFNKKVDSGGPYFIENFSITGGQDVNNVVQNDIKKPLRALEFGETGDVIDIRFFNPPGELYRDHIRTNIVHTYDFEEKKFHIDSNDGNIVNVKNNFTDYYVRPMKGKDGSQPAPNFIITDTQKTNQNFNNVFSVFSEDSDFIKLAVGRNEILKHAIKLNLGIELTVQGGLHRQAGRFISIDRKGSYIENDFDNKFLGIYFILHVQHIFQNDDVFLDKIVAVKTYNFIDLKNREDIV